MREWCGMTRLWIHEASFELSAVIGPWWQNCSTSISVVQPAAPKHLMSSQFTTPDKFWTDGNCSFILVVNEIPANHCDSLPYNKLHNKALIGSNVIRKWSDSLIRQQGLHWPQNWIFLERLPGGYPLGFWFPDDLSNGELIHSSVRSTSPLALAVLH